LLAFPFDRIRSILLSLQELLWKHKGCHEELKKIKASAMNLVGLMQSGLVQACWSSPERIRDLVDKLRNGSVKLVSPPKNFNTILRPYQLEGLSWMQFLAANKFGGILADDMGLGKTVQVLAHMCLEKEAGRLENPFLVVCPTSVLPNWISETEKFAPRLRILSLAGSDRFSRFRKVGAADVVLTTYPLIARDAQFYKAIEWHGIALDEAQFVKNPDTQAAMLVCQLKANHRFCVTGTPIENHLGDLWSHFHFLIPDLLGERSSFNRHIREPIEKCGDMRMRQVLARRVAPFVLRRTKAQVAAELPKKSIIIKCIQLEGEQRDLYETVRLATQKRIREEIAEKGILQSQIIILEALLRLRQTRCDPRLVKLELARKVKQSAKLDQVIEMISELHEQERKMLVFSQFTSMLDLIAGELKRVQIPFVELRGDTVDRATPVKNFQESDIPVFLISLRAGGTGLNLTAADTVIHYDPWWNPAVEAQATDRAHRIGQTKNVFVYKLIAEGTIEQRMLELQETKGRLARGIFEDAQGPGPSAGGFSEKDLEELLKPMEILEMKRDVAIQT
jgi:SNF2 family DNA or RNA helicase